MGCATSFEKDSDMDKLYDDLLVELECPICLTYMCPPIRQCATGHSICEPCRKRLPRCPLCQGKFTDSKNISLEALALKMHYPCANSKDGCPERLTLKERDFHEHSCPYRCSPCVNARAGCPQRLTVKEKDLHEQICTYRLYTCINPGCTQRLTLKERDVHELVCTHRGYKCPFPKCIWYGRYEDIAEHWLQKKNLSRPYRDTNVCHTKIIKAQQFYVNMVEAYDELFWHKFNLDNGKLYWTIQFIGPKERADEFYFEIEIFKPGKPFRKILMSEHCQPINLVGSREIFKAGNCVQTTMEAVQPFFGEDQLLIYYMKVKQVEADDRRQRDQSRGRDYCRRDQSCSKDSVCSDSAKSDRGNNQRGGRGGKQHFNKKNHYRKQQNQN